MSRTISGGARRYDVRWRRSDGRTVTKTFSRRRDADAFCHRLASDALVGLEIDYSQGQRPVSEIAAAWLGSNPAKRPRSVRYDAAVLANRLCPVLGRRPIRSVTQADIQGLVNNWSVTHAASTVIRMYSTTRAVFSYAVAADILSRSPCRQIRLPRAALTDRPILDAEQLQRVAEALDEQDAPMMWLGAVLGLRWGEAAGLRSGRVDLDAGTVAVVEQLDRDLETRAPKSATGRRVLACPDWLCDMLGRHIDSQPRTISDDSFLFVTVRGRPWQYTSWRRGIWKPAVAAAGMPDLRYHDLRSNAATALVATGVDIKTAQNRLGHSTPILTLAVYARAARDADRRAAELVGERLRPRDNRAITNGQPAPVPSISKPAHA